ncbi:MAG: helix-turn-helix transcriptional regulator [Desulfobacterales bacterium]
MSRQITMDQKNINTPGSGKQDRYIQPSILLALRIKPSYGYELIKDIQNFGFVEGQAPPGMIYRHLRQMEEDGLVSSQWETDGTGPAKRMYAITPDGRELLVLWIEYMESISRKLQNFIAMFRSSAG